MFRKVLIANRGDIAVRILRACKELGISTVAVHSECDSNLMNVRLADESVCIGPNRSLDSYLNISSILSAAELTGVDAIHPGVGFLSENEKFAKMVVEHNMKFIGPRPEHISMMGNKIIAKKTMQKLGVPVVTGSDGEVHSVDEAVSIAESTGYPVIFKATNGGGGKGMKIANNSAEIANAFKMAKSEAKANFGSDNVYMERYLARPQHIEIQVIADNYGNVVHLGERNCSLQRNHQKLLEEAPSITISDSEREKIGNIVTDAVREIRYVGVGTLEFLYENGEFFFMEMNTRIQVEHPITEMVTGIDIVREQIKIASGERLPFSQKDVKIAGHAIEFRINAEDPKTFTPSPGNINELHFPGGNGVRVDSHVYRNYTVPPYYDSLIAKIIVYGNDRDECLMKGRRAMSELVIEGISTTTDLHKKLLDNGDIIRGDYDIHWLTDNLENI
jgi:acetyl-CoA carboxylase biotin carboxylase subunit